MNAGNSEPPRLLLLEEHALLRTTIAGVARQLGLARVHELARADAVLPLLKEVPIDGLLVTLDCNGHTLALLDAIRLGATPCPASLPVAVMTADCDSELAKRLRALDVRRVILKPFKAKTALETIAGLWRHADDRVPSRHPAAVADACRPASCQ